MIANTKQQIEELLPRCETTDKHDFPDLKEDERCYSCKLWEAIDQYTQSKLKAFAGEVSDKILDFGSWQEDKCRLHEKYTSACCGCQKERRALHMMEDYQAYIAEALKAIKEKAGIE